MHLINVHIVIVVKTLPFQYILQLQLIIQFLLQQSWAKSGCIFATIGICLCQTVYQSAFHLLVHNSLSLYKFSFHFQIQLTDVNFQLLLSVYWQLLLIGITLYPLINLVDLLVIWQCSELVHHTVSSPLLPDLLLATVFGIWCWVVWWNMPNFSKVGSRYNELRWAKNYPPLSWDVKC